MSDLHQRLKTLLFMVPFVYRHRSVPIEELAARLGIEEKKLLKEIDFLLMVGRPPFSPDDLVDIHLDSGRVFVELPSSLEQPPSFSVFEALALACAAQLFASSEEIGEASTAIRLAMQKILSSLPPENRALFDQLSDRYLVMSAAGVTPHIDLLNKAVDNSLEVEMTYFTAGRGEVSQRVVRPYGLTHSSGVWYLAAYCTERQAERVFRLSRIMQLSLSERIFDPPTGFDVTEFVKDAMVLPDQGARTVVIRFGPEDARWVSERWEDQYLKHQEDGGLLFTMPDVSDEFVLSYVASFAGRATIQHPPELAQKFAQQAVDTLNIYK